MTIGKQKRNRLLRKILESEQDVMTLATEQSIRPDELAAWSEDENNLRVLTALCRLADLQSQWLLSRFRMVAASRLIRLATESEQGETARKACIDLLKLERLMSANSETASTDPGFDPQALEDFVQTFYRRDTSKNDPPR